MLNGGTLRMEIGGLQPNEHDRIVLTGSCAMAGTINVNFVNNYQPTGLVNFPLVTAAGLSGQIANLVAPPGFWIRYRQSQILLSNICEADIDNGSASGSPDGAVTIDDLLYFLGAFEAGDVAADLDNGSGTGIPDNAVTIDDLLWFLARFEAGC